MGVLSTRYSDNYLVTEQYSNLILTGGINHDFDDTSAALAEVLGQAGIQSTIYSDFDKGFAELGSQKFDLVTLFALRWRMLDNDKYIPHREEWAYEISETDRTNLKQHIASGGGMLGLHTAAICFDTWEQWPALLGAQWSWGDTFHPPPESFEVQISNADHPSTNGLAAFTVTDEIYHNLKPEPASTALISTNSGQDDSNQILGWANEANGGRVIYNALGHDRQSVTAPGHAQFLQQAARWCCGENG